MKYLIIAALISIIFVLIYSRVRPYLKLIRNVAESLNSATEPRVPSKNKLVRCDGCGTWIPAQRALQLNAGLANFCSRDCLEKRAETRSRKMAG